MEEKLFLEIPMPVDSGNTGLCSIAVEKLELPTKEEEGDLVKQIQRLHQLRWKLSNVFIRKGLLAVSIEEAIAATANYILELENFIGSCKYDGLESRRCIIFNWLQLFQNDDQKNRDGCTSLCYELLMLYHTLGTLLYKKGNDILLLEEKNRKPLIKNASTQFQHAAWCFGKCKEILTIDWTAKPPTKSLPLTVVFQPLYDILSMLCTAAIQAQWAAMKKLTTTESHKFLSNLYMAQAENYHSALLMLEEHERELPRHIFKNVIDLKKKLAQKYSIVLWQSYKKMIRVANKESENGDITFMLPTLKTAVQRIPSYIEPPADLLLKIKQLTSNHTTSYCRSEQSIESIQQKSKYVPTPIKMNVPFSKPPCLIKEST